jgi:hypothetical protein
LSSGERQLKTPQGTLTGVLAGGSSRVIPILVPRMNSLRNIVHVMMYIQRTGTRQMTL